MCGAVSTSTSTSTRPAAAAAPAWTRRRAAIQDGRLTPGTRLPATRVLAGELGVARGTVTAAYDQLVAEGYLSARRGAGTVIADVPVPSGNRAERRPRAVPPVPPVRHDLLPGRPDVSAFPVQAWLRAARTVLPRVETAAFGVGDPRGRPELRSALVEYLGRTRGVITDPDSIVITSGFMQALGLIARVLHDRGCATIAMEDPCLPFHRRWCAAPGRESCRSRSTRSAPAATCPPTSVRLC